MLREACYGKLPNGKAEGLICVCVCVCNASALRGDTVQWVKGDDAAVGRSGEWSAAMGVIMRLGILQGDCSHVIHTGVKRAEA